VDLHRGIRGVIFDLDGTLVDSAGEIAAALNVVLVQLERAPLPRVEVEGLIGHGVRSLVERALRIARVPMTELERAIQRFEEAYAANVGTEATLFPGTRGALALLEQAGVARSVVTNKPRYFTEQLLARLGVAGLFDAVVAGDDGLRRKPAGDMLLAAARAMRCDIDSSLMIGDSDNDVLAARDAGCIVWCVPYGYNEGKPADALACDRLVQTLEDAARLLVGHAL
jgi:phosphoglycolate phosphatase